LSCCTSSCENNWKCAEPDCEILFNTALQRGASPRRYSQTASAIFEHVLANCLKQLLSCRR
jgi:hypothetical protein